MIYCGDILEDDASISNYDIHSGSTIHVLRKIEPIPTEKEYPRFTESDVQRIVSLYRSLSPTYFHKITQKDIFKRILDSCPEIRSDLVGVASLRDPIILATLSNPDVVRKFAVNHRAVIEASETIIKILKTHGGSVKRENVSPIESAGDDQLSDSSSSSGSENSPSTSRGSRGRGAPYGLRRITFDQLAAALGQFSNANSLANLSQRDLPNPPDSAQSPASGSRSQITPSMVMNALSGVLRSNLDNRVPPTQNPTSEVSADAAVPEPESISDPTPINEDIDMENDEDAQMIAGFQPKLRQMEDLGLFNKSQNIQALMICNGDLEAAVNLVLSGMN